MDQMAAAIAAVLEKMALRTLLVMGEAAGAKARTISQDQSSFYSDLFRICVDMPVKVVDGEIARGDNNFNATLSNVSGWCQGILQSMPPNFAEHPGGTVIFSMLPVLTREAVDDLKQKFPTEDNKFASPSEVLYLQMLVAGAALGEVAPGAPSPISNTRDNVHGHYISAALSLYQSARAVHRQRSTAIESFEKRIAGVVGTAENAKAEMDNTIAEYRSRLDSFAAAHDELQQKLSSSETEVVSTKKRLEDFETTIRSEMGLNQTRAHWNLRYQEARRQFYVAVGLLVLTTGLVILVAALLGPGVMDRLNRMDWLHLLANGSAATAVANQAGRLLIISVPVLAVFWMMRVLVRYFMRSMLLMDDARQRQVMLDTYFLLTEAGRADERDRPLILWALFRQTPGHGPDGIDPPDFTEVINAGLKRAGAEKP